MNWIGEAWRELKESHALFTKLFEKTGCLMTVDRSCDENIKPQGLDNYTF